MGIQWENVGFSLGNEEFLMGNGNSTWYIVKVGFFYIQEMYKTYFYNLHAERFFFFVFQKEN